jgi:hypothetical protein
MQQKVDSRAGACRSCDLLENDMYHFLTFIKNDPSPVDGKESRWIIISQLSPFRLNSLISGDDDITALKLTVIYNAFR